MNDGEISRRGTQTLDKDLCVVKYVAFNLNILYNTFRHSLLEYISILYAPIKDIYFNERRSFFLCKLK